MPNPHKSINMKTGTILKCNFTNEWVNPSGKTVYYHQVILDNGDVGNIGTFDKYPNKISTGTSIQYTIENSKLKILSEQTPMDSSKYGNSAFKSSSKKSYTQAAKSHVDFLGYSWSYAKDLVIAGKTMKDVEELNKIARYIHQQVTEMLSGEQPDTPKSDNNSLF